MLKSILVTILAFVSPISPLMFVIGVLIMSDTFVGRWRAKRIAILRGKDYKQVVTSRKTRLGFVSKTIGYNVVILTTFILDKYMLNEVVINYIPFEFLATKVCGIFLMKIEWDSINESVRMVRGWDYNDKIHEFFKWLKRCILFVIKFKNDVKQ